MTGMTRTEKTLFHIVLEYACFVLAGLGDVEWFSPLRVEVLVNNGRQISM